MVGIFNIDPDYRSKLLKEFGFKEEELEIIKNQHGKTGFPESLKDYHLEWEVNDLSLEEPYYWIVRNMQEFLPIVEKLEDSFAAAENSAFFGVTQQRLGAQQDKISQLLATAGKMIKELFQMVRELRIIDERLAYYTEVEEQLKKPVEERSKSADVTLKGLFVDLVQGGGKSAASVYGMARELEFITLPDLFFDAPPFKNTHELDEHIKSLEANFNRNVLRVLPRHLRQYMEWRTRTYQEHVNRKRFQKAYLKQHFEIIKMYINWIKPYLRHIARLSLKEQNMNSPEIVSAFEGSMLDIELLGRKRSAEKEANGCILATFHYRTRAEMKVVQEGYQRGPVHVGKFEMYLRVYGWSDQEVENYKKLKQKETLVFMGEISASVQAAMESLGEELTQYLNEPDSNQEKGEAPPQRSIFERLLGDFYTPPKNKEKKEKGSSKRDEKRKEQEREEEINSLVGYTKFVCFHMYRNFKKAHRMTMW